MISHHLLWDTIQLDSLFEHVDRVLGCGVAKHATSCDEPGCIILEKDELLLGLFEPIRMPQDIAKSTFIPDVRTLSLFMRFIFRESFLFEDPMDPVMTNVDLLFCEDLFESDRSQRMAAVRLDDNMFFFRGNR